MSEVIIKQNPMSGGDIEISKTDGKNVSILQGRKFTFIHKENISAVIAALTKLKDEQ